MLAWKLPNNVALWDFTILTDRNQREPVLEVGTGENTGLQAARTRVGQVERPGIEVIVEAIADVDWFTRSATAEFEVICDHSARSEDRLTALDPTHGVGLGTGETSEE